jgi:hypothetical protein
MSRACLCIAIVVVGFNAPALGHHSFPAFYFEEQSISVEGEIVAFEYRSPHAWVHVRARDPQGELRTFAAEWANPNRLARAKISQDTLRVGDHVIVSGSPGRNADEFKLHLKAIERPADGWKWVGRRR